MMNNQIRDIVIVVRYVFVLIHAGSVFKNSSVVYFNIAAAAVILLKND
jgi:hypothetical protein